MLRLLTGPAKSICQIIKLWISWQMRDMRRQPRLIQIFQILRSTCPGLLGCQLRKDFINWPRSTVSATLYLFDRQGRYYSGGTLAHWADRKLAHYV